MTIYDIKFHGDLRRREPETIFDVVRVCQCGAPVFYDVRAGRFPISCGKGACKSKAMKQGRRPMQWKQAIKK